VVARRGGSGPHTAGERESLGHDGSTTLAVSYGHAGLSQPVEARESTPQTIHAYGVGEREESAAMEKGSEGVRRALQAKRKARGCGRTDKR
jgi:hypothetical protein